MDLAKFLADRLDEDEAVAKAAYCYGPNSMQPAAPPEGTWWTTAQIMERFGVGTYNDAVHIARHDPARVLREVEAKRKILAWWQRGDRDPAPSPTYEEWRRSLPGYQLILALAAIYSDHEDYDPAWKDTSWTCPGS
jgi:hypothetical protein